MTLPTVLTASGVYSKVSTIAGDGTDGFVDGPALNAKFKMPHGITCDIIGDVYVSDTYNNCVRKIDAYSGKVTTINGGHSKFGDIGKFNNPRGITCDSLGNIYVADSYNNRICKIDAYSEEVTTIAGSSFGFSDGVGSVAKFWNPYGITCDSEDNLYVVDKLNQRIRKLFLEKDGKTWQVLTIAGNGKTGLVDSFDDGLKAQFHYPAGITCDSAGNLYVTDTNNHCVRKIDRSGGVTTIAGSTPGYVDSRKNGLKAKFEYPYGITCDSAGNLYVADKVNNRIRKIDTFGGVTTIAGDGSFDFSDSAISLKAKFFSPYGIACDIYDNLYVADTYNNLIRKIANKPDTALGTEDIVLYLP
ncbi:MAG: NHL repeat-containing protein [Proteobacteria bacterium]|nr:NHL repeat-containing protein [Pseudomonadota bacterium]